MKSVQIKSLILLVLTIILVVYVYHRGYKTGSAESTAVTYSYTDVELDRCPMCGHTVKLHPVRDSWYISCDKFDDVTACGLQTGYYSNPDELVAAWNNIDE